MHILVQLRIYAPHICDCAYYRVTSFFLVFFGCLQVPMPTSLYRFFSKNTCRWQQLNI